MDSLFLLPTQVLPHSDQMQIPTPYLEFSLQHCSANRGRVGPFPPDI